MALLFVAAAFFSVLAMDIAVPALVLSAMALSNVLVSSAAPSRHWKDQAA